MARIKTELNPDILEVKQNVWLGLSLRQLICAGIGIATAGISYLSLSEKIGMQPASWVAVASAAVFMFFGFFKFNGMTAGQFLLAIYRDLNNPMEISASMNNLYYNKIEETMKKGKKKRATSKKHKANGNEDGSTASTGATDERLNSGKENL